MSVKIALQNQTQSGYVNAYITGSAIDSGNALCLISSDGQTPYFPESPGGTEGLAQDCAIRLGNPGETIYVTVPHLAGARIWFCVDDTLDFFVNPGPSLVEPSVTNYSDPNINKKWSFCEFTFSADQLYANISYVDFVSVSASLTLTNESDGVQHISGMDESGMDRVAQGLQDQAATDGQPWDQLIVRSQEDGSVIRVISPNAHLTSAGDAFGSYYDDYVNQVWERYQGEVLTVDTQAAWGQAQGQAGDGENLNFGGANFTRPSTADIFSCSTGPFAAGNGASEEQLNIGARLAAAFHRSTLLDVDQQPHGADPSQYYQREPTNHYSRVVHEANLDGRGYAFPYDDVSGGQGVDQSGFVNDPAPKLLTVTIGGQGATPDGNEAAQRQQDIVNSCPW